MTRAILALALIVAPASAEPTCDTPARMGEFLRSYGEEPTGVFPESDSALMVWVSPDGRSWTILRLSDDRACIVASGTGAMTMDEVRDATLGAPL